MLFDNYSTFYDPTVFSISLSDGPLRPRSKSSSLDSPRRSTRSTHEEDHFDEQISALEAQLANKRFIQNALSNGPPVTLDFDGTGEEEYRLFVSSDIVLDPNASALIMSAPGSPELKSFDEDSFEGSPMSPAQKKGSRPSRRCKKEVVSPTAQQKRKSNSRKEADSVTTIDFSFDSISTITPSDEDAEEFEQFNIEISEVDKRTRECVTTVITTVTPLTKTKRKGSSSTPKQTKSQTKRSKKNGKDYVDDEVNFLSTKEKVTRLPTFQGEEILRIEVVEVENEEVDILN